jgi:2-dehydro-3-deoxygalactonokinase
MFNNSILAASVQENDMQDPTLQSVFQKGVRLGAEENILHVMFRVRANGLFNKATKEENFALLSGMLIGSELKELSSIKADSIFVCGSQDMCVAYEQALQELNLLDGKQFYSIAAGEATALGQIDIYKWSGLINFDL